MAAAPALRLRTTLPSHPRFLPFVRTLAGEGAAAAGFSDDERDRIELAVVEGFTNVIRHAYGNRHDLPIDLDVHAPAGALAVQIVDRGRFVDPSTFRSRALEDVRPGGLGVHLMKTTMDVVEYRENDHGGTTLTLQRALPGDPR